MGSEIKCFWCEFPFLDIGLCSCCFQPHEEQDQTFSQKTWSLNQSIRPSLSVLEMKITHDTNILNSYDKQGGCYKWIDISN